MNRFIGLLSLLITGTILQAQQISLGEISRNARFNQQIDESNNGKSKIKYSDIQGIPYYYPQFTNAKIGDTSSTVPLRYNIFLDTIEVVEKEDVYELPKDEPTPAFTFLTTKEKLVFVKTDDLYSGYFFELTDGKYRILKKVSTKYLPATPAPNTLIAGSPAQFIPQKSIYFIKTENRFIKMPKSTKELAAELPEKAKEIKDFIDKNKIKLNREEDLIKLGNFLNQ
ncbi:hypothetical protein Q73A0000_10320 [Kaistella flava (ex Peng et al. 2021)]|uniref:Uncharacterized protein n=1 Tax=Kaistella flava (ex Peng et al. 2021) TaxID=2038776 RepID=A0A7M2Y908_9FLAO|nr:hypothetical protein [Kaistella flava (ex Peng et al. 2021)]QOW10738.1 hypothetical protein Q73A0000_10320 [Kaistella flava (ex Peng et al. 2021)]